MTGLDETHLHDVRRQPGLPPEPRLHHRRNAAINIVGESFWGFQWHMVLSSTVLATLLESLGAGSRTIGSITAVEAAGFVLPQLAGAYLFCSRRHRKVQVLVYHLVLMIPLLPVMGLLALNAAAFPPAALRWLLLATWAGYIASIGVIGSVWWDWVAHLFPQRIRGKVMGVSFCCSAGAGFLGARLAGGHIHEATLHGLPVTTAYGHLYLAAGLVAALGMSLFFLVDDPDAHQPDIATRPSLPELLGHFRASLRDANFRAFLVARLLTGAGFCVMPLIAAYYTSPRGGGLDGATVVKAGALMALASAGANLSFGYLGDRHGYRIALLSSAAMQVVTLAVVLLATGTHGAYAAYACAGISMGATFISHNNLLFETCSHENRVAHITVGNLVLSPGTILAPLLAGTLAELVGLRIIFLACLIVSALALLWSALGLCEPRTLAAASHPARAAARAPAPIDVP